MENFSLDECDICGGDHYTEQCSELGVDEKSFQLTTKARSTIPNNLDVRELENGMVQVVAIAGIPSKTRFGPLEARRLNGDKDIPNGFVFKIVGRGPTMTLDTSSEDLCNWMILVRTADTLAEKNLMVFQVGHDIYFSALRDIGVGEELRLWYAPHYAKKLGKPIDPDPNISSLLYMQSEWNELNPVLPVVETANQIQTTTLEQLFNANKPLAIEETPDYIGEEDEADYSEVKIEPFASNPMTCTRCSKIFYDKTQLAIHIQNHLKIHMCDMCDMSFFNMHALKRHMKMFHRTPSRGYKHTNQETYLGKHIKREIDDENNKSSVSPRKHRYSTRGIRLDMARLTGIKQELDDEDYTPPRHVIPRSTKPTRGVKRGRGRPRKYPVVNSGTPVVGTAKMISVGRGKTVAIDLGSEDIEPTDDEEVRKVIDSVVNAIEATSNVTGEGIPDSEVNEETDAGQIVAGEVLDDCYDDDDDDEDYVSAGRTEDEIVNMDIGVPDINLSEEEVIEYEAESKGLTIDRIYLKLVSDDKKKNYVSYSNPDSQNVVYYECRVCNAIFSKDIFADKHVFENHGFACSYCFTTFEKDISYQFHRCKEMVDDVQPDDDGMYQCPECEKIYDSLDKLHPHLFGHRRRLECRLCKRSFMRKETYFKHACSAKRPVKKRHRCDICMMVFSTEKYLFRHLAAHTQRFKCSKCSKAFSRKQSLLSHINKCNPRQFASMKMQAFPCKICNRVFSNEVKLQNHMAVHEGKFRCDVCFKQFTSKMTQDAHTCLQFDTTSSLDPSESSINKDGVYACNICNKRFNSEKVLEKHMSCHNEKLQCDFCENEFQRKLELSSHVVMCQANAQLKEQGKITCDADDCEKSFTDAVDYRKHIDLNHVTPFKCEKCLRRFRNLLKKLEHQRVCMKLTTQQIENLVCQSCGRMFRDVQCLKRHMVTHQRPQFRCNDCGKDFLRRDYFNRHICRRADGTVVQLSRDKYDGFEEDVSPHICHLCGNSYVSFGNLNKHLLRHGEKTIKCPVCEKMFHLESAMKEHLKHVHSEEKNAQCPHCGKTMKSKNSLGAHIKQFHKDNAVFYPCPHCGKAFRQRGNMVKHMLMHSTQKTYSCPYCDKMFKYPEQLHKHKTEHEIGRQYHCEDCNRSFVKDYELRKHNTVFHSGITYTCEFCPTDCRHIHTLKRHIRRRHPDRIYLLNDIGYLRSLQRVLPESNTLHYQRSRSISNVESSESSIQTIRILQPTENGETQEMEIEVSGLDNDNINEVTVQEIQNTPELQHVQHIVNEATQVVSRDQVEDGQTVSIEFMSQEAAEVLQSLSGNNQVQTVSFADLSQLTNEQGATHIIQQDEESQEYILVPLIQSSDQHTIMTSN